MQMELALRVKTINKKKWEWTHILSSFQVTSLQNLPAFVHTLPLLGSCLLNFVQSLQLLPEVG